MQIPKTVSDEPPLVPIRKPMHRIASSVHKLRDSLSLIPGWAFDSI